MASLRSYRDWPKFEAYVEENSVARSHAITGWDPEDRAAWEAGGEAIARRNLVWSVVAEHVGFSVWSLWSVMVLFMPQSVYGLTTGDKFLVAATATLVGSALRLPYTMATARFGGRNWTVFSACVLVLPVVATIVVLAEPGQPLWVYLVCAALCGLGGGNFASSMTNINAFFPQRFKGWALGINAGGGNIGVPAGAQHVRGGVALGAQSTSVSGVISAAGRLRHSAVGHVQFHAADHAAVTAHRGNRLHAPSRHPSIGPMVAPPYFDAPRRRLRPYQLDLSPRVRSL
jgi:hypothetical protein